MEYRHFGKTDLKVSVIGMGTWQGSMKGWGRDYTKESIVSAIREAFENGINFFDTAEIYGSGLSERILGEALSKYSRDDFIVATKIAPFNLKNPEKSLDMSLKRLGLKYVDIYQIHWPPSIYTSIEKSLGMLKRLVEEGKVRYIGVSNFDLDLIQRAENYGIVSDQIKYNILHTDAEKDLLPHARKMNIEIIAYSPLEMGALTGKYTSKRKPEGYLRRTGGIFSEKNLPKLEQLSSFLKNIAEKYGCTVTQLSLAYIVKKGILPIPGAKNSEQARQNALAYKVKLSDDDMRSIDAFVNGLDLNYNSHWYKYVRFIPSFIQKLIFSGVI